MAPLSSFSFGGEGVAAHSAATSLEPDQAAPAEEIVVGDELQVGEQREPIDDGELTAAADFWHPIVDYPWGQWRARVGTILLNQTRPSEQNLKGVLPPFSDYYFGASFGPRANASDFAFPLSAGVDVALRRPGELVDLDFRYFGVNQSTATWGPYSGSESWYFGIFGYSSPWSVESQLQSSLQSAELNLRRAITPNVALLCGFRYLQFREALLSRELFGSTPVLIAFDLRGQNELFGFQVGNEVSVAHIGDRLSIDLFAKMGVFGNVASSNFTSTWAFPHVPPEVYRVEANRGVASLMLEAGASVNFQLTRHLALRGGYQILNLTDLATATGQAPVVYNPTFTTLTDDNVLFHGATAGLEWGW